MVTKPNSYKKLTHPVEEALHEPLDGIEVGIHIIAILYPEKQSTANLQHWH